VPIARHAPVGLGPGGRFDTWAEVPPAYVALDVDGTLLRDAPVPAEDILAAVAGLVSVGTRVGLATGRMAAASETILATGVFTGPHVFHNGAVVTDSSGVDQHVLGLSSDEVAAVLDLGRGRDDLSVEIYVGRTYLADRDDPRSAPHMKLLGAAPSGTISLVEDLAGRPAIKAVMVCFSAEAAEDMVRSVTELGLAAGPAASPATPDIRYVNVTRAGVDKGSGLLMAARSIDVPLPAVAFLGDETNDLPALSLAGTAIAMGGSAPGIISAAHLVAPGYSADGARIAIEALTALTHGAQRAPGTW
jgi:hydroxymethylpyrimidine pyrophosphatase-like HAD family hydrolase